MEQLCQEGGLVNCLVFGFPLVRSSGCCILLSPCQLTACLINVNEVLYMWV